MSQLLNWEVQNGFLSSMKMMAGFQVWKYQKSLLETVTSLQIIPPSMEVKLDIIVPLRLIVTSIPIFLLGTVEFCNNQNKYAQLLNSLKSYQLQIMLQS